jgi:molybdenum cofactor cytidylyltransferase
MIAHVIDQVLTSPVEHFVVVVGSDPRVSAALADRPLTLVANPEPEGDMLSSVRCGLRALPDGCDGVLVVLGDQPAVRPELIVEMIRAFRETGRTIVVPTWHGTRGHPLLFSAAYREEILRDHNAIGLRGLLHAHPDEIHELDAADPAVLSDVDLPEDYDREVGSGQ